MFYARATTNFAKIAILLAIMVFPSKKSDARVYTGLEVFLSQPQYVHLVAGKRVALLTNQTGADFHGRSTISLFHADKRISLRLLFAPEHGIYGTLKAGETVKGGVDKKT